MKVQGSIIINIFEKLNIEIINKHQPQYDWKQEQNFTYKMANGLINTAGKTEITIHYYWDYQLIIDDKMIEIAYAYGLEDVSYIRRLLNDIEIQNIKKWM